MINAVSTFPSNYNVRKLYLPEIDIHGDPQFQAFSYMTPPVYDYIRRCKFLSSIVEGAVQL